MSRDRNEWSCTLGQGGGPALHTNQLPSNHTMRANNDPQSDAGYVWVQLVYVYFQRNYLSSSGCFHKFVQQACDVAPKVLKPNQFLDDKN